MVCLIDTYLTIRIFTKCKKYSVSNLKAENSSLLNDIEFLRTRITNIEFTSDNQHFATLNHSMSNLLKEMTERDKCSHNIIVHDLQECDSTITTERIDSDFYFSTITSQQLYSLSFIVSFARSIVIYTWPD